MSTYTLTDHGITCHVCGRSSANPTDMRERYCGYCHVFHDDIPTTELTAELQQLAPMELHLRPETVLQLVGLMQLALRHPNVPAVIRETADRFLDGGREYFASTAAVLAVIRLGDDPQKDR